MIEIQSLSTINYQLIESIESLSKFRLHVKLHCPLSRSILCWILKYFHILRLISTGFSNSISIRNKNRRIAGEPCPTPQLARYPRHWCFNLHSSGRWSPMSKNVSRHSQIEDEKLLLYGILRMVKSNSNL